MDKTITGLLITQTFHNLNDGQGAVPLLALSEGEFTEKDVFVESRKHLGCNLITATDISINGNYVTILSDDEGLYNTPKVALDSELVGGFQFEDDQGGVHNIPGSVVLLGFDPKVGKMLSCPITKDALNKLHAKQRFYSIKLSA